MYLRSLGNRKCLNLTSRHIHQGHLDSGSRAGREPRSPFHPFARCRPPLPALLVPALCQRPSHARGAASLAPGARRRASPAHCSQQLAFRRERSRARCSEHPLQPEQAFRRERSRACTPAGAHTGRRRPAPRRKARRPDVEHIRVGSRPQPNGERIRFILQRWRFTACQG